MSVNRSRAIFWHPGEFFHRMARFARFMEEDWAMRELDKDDSTQKKLQSGTWP